MQTWKGKADSKSAKVMLPSLKADLIIGDDDDDDEGCAKLDRNPEYF